MSTRLLLGAGLLTVAAVALWVRLAGTRQLDILDEGYPPDRDDYLDTLLGIGG